MAVNPTNARKNTNHNHHVEQDNSDLFFVFSNHKGVVLRHLKLSFFKSDPCQLTAPHHTKKCQHFHTEIDRRRTNRVYSAMICKDSL